MLLGLKCDREINVNSMDHLRCRHTDMQRHGESFVCARTGRD